MNYAHLLLPYFVILLEFPRLVDAADDPPRDEGHFYLPSTFDAREYYKDCEKFYGVVGRSSFACGDCWAHASTQMLATSLCVAIAEDDEDEPRVPQDPLSAFYAVTCADWAQNGCIGQAWSILRSVYGSGVPTGCNIPETPSNLCKNYRLPLCDRHKPMPRECPNKADKHKKFEIKRSDCIRDKCDDPTTTMVLYGKGSADVPILNSKSNIAEIKWAILRNGSVLASYWCGNKFKRLQNCKTDCPTITENESNYIKDAENHMVSIVGWNTEKTKSGKLIDVWEVKNPNHGYTFGRNGYFRVLQGANINSIEKQVFGIINYSWKPCRPLPFKERRIIPIDGIDRVCKAEGGQRCRDGCVEKKYEMRKLDFLCRTETGVVGTTKSVKVSLSCA